MKIRKSLTVAAAVLGFLALTGPAFGSDAETTAELEALHVELQTNMNFIWVMAAAALVFLMQGGFMCLESGLARAKNSINVSIKNMADFLMAVAGYWVVGFGLMFGISKSGLFGTTDFFMEIANDPWRAAFFVFQAVFCGTAATIVSGAVAERTRFVSYLIISLLISALIYPVFGHWAWGSFLHGGAPGWLEGKGFIDFAGSTVVHSVGGWVALAGIIVVGPRLGKFDENGKPRKIQASNLPMVYLGTFILFFGWFGFNCGSTLAANTDIAGIAINTVLAACFGGITASVMSWVFSEEKHPEAEMIANGVLAGLVGITAGCAVVETSGAAVIGITSGALMFGASNFIERVLKLDDVVGAIPVHGVCGAWGTFSLALVMPEAALGGVPRLTQLGVQSIGVGAGFVWAFGLAFLILKVLNFFIPMRVDPEAEKIGLNISEHGAKSFALDLAHAMYSATNTGRYNDAMKVEVEEGTEIGHLCHHFNLMVDAIKTEQQQVEEAAQKKAKDLEQYKQYMHYMQEAVAEVREETEQMDTVLRDTADQAEKMSESVDTAASTVGELMQSLIGVSQESSDAYGTARQAQEESTRSKSTVDALGASASDIGQIVTSIEDIATATKLLALNASIEAARVGAAGKGFAVVAEKVQDLSEESEQSVNMIRDRIEGMQGITTDAVGNLASISGVIEKIHDINRGISVHVGEQAEKAKEVEGFIGLASTAVHDMRSCVERVGVGAKKVANRITEVYDQFQKLLSDTDETETRQAA